MPAGPRVPARGADHLDDDELLERFERGGLEPGEWDHVAHVRSARVLLGRCAFAVALERMRGGLERLNIRHGTPVDVLDRGYHETLTVAWLAVIAATMRSGGALADSRAFCAANPHLLARTLMRLYYRRERLMSFEAKRAFVAPDLAPLPLAPDELPAPLD